MAGAILGWLFAHGMLDLGMIHAVVASPVTLAVVLGLAVLSYQISVYRWRLLLRGQDVRIPVRAATNITFLGLFLNSFLPGGGVGGEAVRVAFVVRTLSAKKTVAVLSVVMDRFLGFYSILLIAFVAALINPASFFGGGLLHYLAVSAAVLCLGTPAGLYLLYAGLKSNRRLRQYMESPADGALSHAIHGIFEALRLYRDDPGILLSALGLSLLINTIGAFCIMIIGSSMGLGSLALIDYASAAPWSWLANLLPITPGGLGVGEAVFDQICHLIEPIRTVAAYGNIFLFYRIVSIIATLPGVAVYFFNHDTMRLLAGNSGGVHGGN